MPATPGTAVYPPAELEALRARGVHLPAPHLVAVGREVPLEAIAAGATLHPFCRLHGTRTRVGRGAVLGAGGAVTVEDSAIGADAAIGTLGPVTLRAVVAGPGTVLGCGVAEDAVFLGKEGDEPDFTAGYGFRVRKGSLYEEDASSAQHTDTKMTVLFPWVTLGSNLNWCDILVAGGTGPALGAFSEIGSGAIHFNFTPRGDKATGSCLGDVVRGVFLREPRVFVGGNGSVLGPATADYGAVTAAGARSGGHLHAGLNPPGADAGPAAGAAFDLEVYGSVRRVYESQVRLIGQLAALEAWYAGVRARLAQGDAARGTLYAAGAEAVRRNRAERIAQLGALAGRLERSVARLEREQPHDPRITQQRALIEGWPTIEGRLAATGAVPEPPVALTAALDAEAAAGRPYTQAIRALPPEAVAAGQAWLQGIAERVADPELLARVPPLG